MPAEGKDEGVILPAEGAAGGEKPEIPPHVASRLGRLRRWANRLRGRYGVPVYLVGSALRADNPDPRDWDVRIMLPDDRFALAFGPVDEWRDEGYTGQWTRTRFRWSDQCVKDTKDFAAWCHLNGDVQLYPESHAATLYADKPRLRLDTFPDEPSPSASRAGGEEKPIVIDRPDGERFVVATGETMAAALRPCAPAAPAAEEPEKCGICGYRKGDPVADGPDDPHTPACAVSWRVIDEDDEDRCPLAPAAEERREGTTGLWRYVPADPRYPFLGQVVLNAEGRPVGSTNTIPDAHQIVAAANAGCDVAAHIEALEGENRDFIAAINEGDEEVKTLTAQRDAATERLARLEEERDELRERVTEIVAGNAAAAVATSRAIHRLLDTAGVEAAPDYMARLASLIARCGAKEGA